MATVSIPGQPRRWGNESTNFYQTSQSSAPGVPSRDKVYRCADNQYTNSGHYHVGTKTVDQGAPLDTYGTASARKLRAEDQRLPKPLFTSTVQARQLGCDEPVDLYQSHHQRYHSYAMSRAPLKRTQSEEPMGEGALARSLNKAFYITSYQSHHSRSLSSDAVRAQSSEVKGDTSAQTLQESLLVRRNSLTDNTKPYLPRRARITSAPPLRTVRPTPSAPVQAANGAPSLQRRRSFTALKQTYPSKGEMLKGIFTAFPAPVPQAASKRQSRPSSAVTLKTGKIPKLRETQAWV